MKLQITHERERLNLSKSALAAKAGIHVSSLSQIENMRLVAYPSQMKKLARALNFKDDPAKLFQPVKEVSE